MPRTVPATRMADIATAARSVFMRKGFRRASVADVAAAVGVSPAALYRHVESKEALFHLCFLEEVPAADEPLATPPDGATLELIRARLDATSRGSTLGRALRTPSDDAAAELTAIITELYRMLQTSRELMALVEASAADRPELHDLYFRQRRGGFTTNLARYLRRGAEAGSLRTVEHPLLVATQIRESCAWFAWHRHTDLDTPTLDDEEALSSIVDTYVNGLVP